MESLSAEEQRKKLEKRTYMREYMKRRYNEKLEDCRDYSKSIKCKKANDLPAEELARFGKYLSYVYKLRVIKQKLPPEIFQEICEEDTIET